MVDLVVRPRHRNVLLGGEGVPDKVLEMIATRCRKRSGRKVRTSVPSHRTAPLPGSYKPAMTLASVVLPEPFSPTRATTSPG